MSGWENLYKGRGMVVDKERYSKERGTVAGPLTSVLEDYYLEYKYHRTNIGTRIYHNR